MCELAWNLVLRTVEEHLFLVFVNMVLRGNEVEGRRLYKNA
jgi:hypothetical protein